MLHDLVSPEGSIVECTRVDANRLSAQVEIRNIPEYFAGFSLLHDQLSFNGKSLLAQLGVDVQEKELHLSFSKRRAELLVELRARGRVAREMLSHIWVGSYIGKLFAADPSRRVRTIPYLLRMLERCDLWADPLLSFGQENPTSLFTEKRGRVIVSLPLHLGVIHYSEGIFGLIPTIGRALKENLHLRHLLALHQILNKERKRTVLQEEILLVRTAALHIRTVFARVVPEELPLGVFHTSAFLLQPDTRGSGDIYELYGEHPREIESIPLEFYTLEPHREHVFFSDRDQLKSTLQDPKLLFSAFSTAPEPKKMPAAAFIVKGSQLRGICAKDWRIERREGEEGTRSLSHSLLPFLSAMKQGIITSQGVLLSRYFPSATLKGFFLDETVQRYIRGIYFLNPAPRRGDFFSYEDRAFLIDLHNFDIPVYWVDRTLHKILRYVQRRGKDSGMFVPLEKVDLFFEATFFGIYGSNLLKGSFQEELFRLMEMVLELRWHMDHPLLHRGKPLALVTGGGPGVMEVGNLVAKELGILSCANIVDFFPHEGSQIREQIRNPHVEAKMIYNLNNLVERQAEFHLDFPIFLIGGAGTDFELALEEVSRKVGVIEPRPVLLFGPIAYWEDKITHRFMRNVREGTIEGSEWTSNCFYCVQSADEALSVYRRFFAHQLPIGKKGPIYSRGFVSVAQEGK